jgi:uncharacterized protein YqgC (DUF456 family)
MDVFLLILAIVCLLAGLVGCIVPLVPGPPLSWMAMLLLSLTRFGSTISWLALLLYAALVLVVTLLDYIVPAWGAKKFGGTRAGTWGAVVGMFFGLFFSFWGIVLCPFLGALVGELIAGRRRQHALKAALGAFLGFLFGTGLKLIVCIWITVACCLIIFRGG